MALEGGRRQQPLHVQVLQRVAQRLRQAARLLHAQRVLAVGVRRVGRQLAQHVARERVLGLPVLTADGQVAEVQRALEVEAVPPARAQLIDGLGLVPQCCGGGHERAAADHVHRDDVEAHAVSHRQAPEGGAHEPHQRSRRVDALVPARERVAVGALHDRGPHRGGAQVVAAIEQVLAQRLGEGVDVGPAQPLRARHAERQSVRLRRQRPQRGLEPRHLFGRVEDRSVRGDAGCQSLGLHAAAHARHEAGGAVHVAPARRQRGQVGHVLRAVDVGVDGHLRVGLEIGEPREVHHHVHVRHELARLPRIEAAQGRAQLRVQHQHLLVHQVVEALAQALAQRPEHGGRAVDLLEALRRVLALLATPQHRHAAHVGHEVEQHGQPHLAHEAGHPSDHDVLASEGLPNGKQAHERSFPSTTGHAWSRAMRRSWRSGFTAQGRPMALSSRLSAALAP